MTTQATRVHLDGAPLTRVFFEAHPEMLPSIASEVPQGWDAQIAGALQALLDLSVQTGVKIGIAQIKSKFAGLRIYLDVDEEQGLSGGLAVVSPTPAVLHLRSASEPGSVQERAMAIVDAAAQRCQALCEQCGARGELLTSRGWYRIACVKHAGVAH
jgi:hypothetical protein